jgi:beta-phosphoglucomutase-like phosphatase (HAD superfamily)
MGLDKGSGWARPVIFDLDGTLVDSEPGYFLCDRAFFAAWGIELDEELNNSTMGQGTGDFLRIVCSHFPDSPLSRLPLEERVAIRDAYYLEHGAAKVKAFPSSAALARKLAAGGHPLAIASGSSPAVIRASLAAPGLAGLFPVLVSASEVARGKPSPDIFLEAARLLAVDPGTCLVLEDSAKGLEAAKAAGMACLVLPAPEADPEGFAGADLLVKDGPGRHSARELEDLVASLLHRLDRAEKKAPPVA